METISFTCNKLDLIIDSLHSIRKDRILAMIQNHIGILTQVLFKAHKKLDLTFLYYLITMGKESLSPPPISLVPKLLKILHKNINGGKSLIELKQRSKLDFLFPQEILLVFKKKVLTSLSHFLPLSVRPSILRIVGLNDHPFKGYQHMKLIKDNRGHRTAFLNYLNKRISHIDRCCLNRFFLSLTERIKEGLMDLMLSSLSHPKNLTYLPVDYYCEIMRPLPKRDLINSNLLWASDLLDRKLLSQRALMKLFNGLPFKLKISGYHSNDHNLTKIKDKMSQFQEDLLMKIPHLNLFLDISTGGI